MLGQIAGVDQMNFEKVSTIGGFAAVMIAVGIAWASLTGKVNRIEAQLSELSENAADDLCLAIVTRQVVAIEKGRKDVTQQLATLASTRGCFKQKEVVVTGSVPSDDNVFVPSDDSIEDAANATEVAAWTAAEKMERRAIEEQLLAIDKKLNIPSGQSVSTR